MSGPAEQWAWQLQDEQLSLSEKFVLVYLARRAYYAARGRRSTPSRRIAIARAVPCCAR